MRPQSAYLTWKQYEQATRIYIKPHIGTIKLKKLRSTHVRQMMTALEEYAEPAKRKNGATYTRRFGARTREVALVTLKVALNAATRESPPLIAENPADVVKPPKKGSPTPKRTLRKPGIHDLLEHCSGHYGPMIALVLSTGVRISEAMGWKWSDLDESFGKRPTLYVTRKLQWFPKQKNDAGEVIRDAWWEFADIKKPKSRRYIPLGYIAIHALEQIRANQLTHREIAGADWPDHDLILTSATGQPVFARNVQRALDKALDRAMLTHMGLHDLRRTAGTHLARSGVPLHVVQNWLGHESIDTTEKHYLDVVEDDMQDAAKFF